MERNLAYLLPENLYRVFNFKDLQEGSRVTRHHSLYASRPSWTGAPCLHRQSRGTTWVEQAGAKPLPMREHNTRKAAGANGPLMA
jgi:hypothetical protein